MAEVIVYNREKQLTRVEHLRPGQTEIEAVHFNQLAECIIRYTDEYAGQASVGGRIYSLQSLKSQAAHEGKVFSVKLSPGDSAHLMHENGGIYVRPINPQQIPESCTTSRPSSGLLSRAAFICSAAITHLLVFVMASVFSARVSSAAHLSIPDTPALKKTVRVEPVQQASFGLDLSVDTEKSQALPPKPRVRKPRKTKPRVQARSVKKKPDVKLDRQAIAKVVRKHMPEVQNCYEMGLLQDPRLAGQVVLEWTISSAGEVRSINTVRNSMRSPTVAMCISAELRNWSFPKHGRGGVVISYPFVFSPTSF